MVLHLLLVHAKHQLKAQQHQQQPEQQQLEPLLSVNDENKDVTTVIDNVAVLHKEIMKILFARGKMENVEASVT
jgi:hypothetical protein